MDTPIVLQPCAGNRLTILDGRRSTAGGMPSYTAGQILQLYNRCLFAEKRQLRSENHQMWEELWSVCPSPDITDRPWYHAVRADIVERIMRHAPTPKAEARDKLQRDLGPREFTLTYSPSWYAEDNDAQNAMRCAIERLTRYYKDEINEFHAIGEYTEAGRSHVHGWYSLKGGLKITDKNFRRAYPHWNPRKKLGKGHEGGHHATIQRVSDFAGYAEKHLEEAWLNINITRNANDDQTSDGTRDPS